MAEMVAKWDATDPSNEVAQKFYKAGPAGIRTTKAMSQECRWPELDNDRENGCIRSVENAFRQDGGLAVLSGNLALDGCIVKSAGVVEEMLHFEGPAVVYESQDDSVEGILNGEVKRVMWLLFATRGQKVVRACKKCCTQQVT